MSETGFDVVIVGGGLAGGLSALALHQSRPTFRIALIEAGQEFGGNHRWSWFDSDLNARGKALMEPFRKTQWPSGYLVKFPQFERHLDTQYSSLSSSDFHEALTRLLPSEALYPGRTANVLDETGVTLDDGTRLNARLVVDCRNFQPSEHLSGGWQIFMGRHIRLNRPHGIKHPVIMDANVDQLAPSGNGGDGNGQGHGAYRFVYVLPLSAHDVFVEDTYYADIAKLDRSALSERIDQYAHQNGWHKGTSIGHETGLLPVLTGGDFHAYQEEMRIPGVVVSGARGGFTHPLTSYTMPMAVENALALADDADLPAGQMVAIFESRARNHWKNTGYYRLLARLLFFAAEPSKRFIIFQRFYRLSQGLIERFYAARSTFQDRARILWGKPPVSIPHAMAAMFKQGAALTSQPSTPHNSDTHLCGTATKTETTQ